MGLPEDFKIATNLEPFPGEILQHYVKLWEYTARLRPDLKEAAKGDKCSIIVNGKDRAREVAARGARAALGAHERPEERVVVVAAAVVAHGHPNRLGNGVQILEQFFQRLLLPPRGLGQGVVEILHVGGVMLAVVNLHRLRIDHRLQRIEGIAQWWKFVRTGGSRSGSSSLGEQIAGGESSGGRGEGWDGRAARLHKGGVVSD